MTAMLSQIAPDLWEARQPLRYLGMAVGTRATFIKLRGGDLFIHSPGSLAPDLRTALDQVGRVRAVVAPNRFHHLFVREYQHAYPDAAFFCAPGLERKRADLKFNAVLTDETPAQWAGEIEQLVFRSFPALNEVVFFHRASKTLLLTDLLFNVKDAPDTMSRIILTLDGASGAPAVPRSFRSVLRLWRRNESRQLIDRILNWDFHRVILTHGEIIESGKEAFRDAWSFV